MLVEDPLSQWLNVVGARCTLSGSLRAAGQWSVGFETESTKINVVTEGQCWLRHAALSAPVPLRRGDGFMLTGADAYVLCSDPALVPMPAERFYDSPHGRWDGGDGPAFTAIGCRIALGALDLEVLRTSLPPVIVVHGDSPQAATLRWLIEKMGTEFAAPSAGSAATAGLLAQMLFVETIRFWRQHGGNETGCLTALRDARIAGAVRMMHDDPARPWRLDELARTVGMSRSAFAGQFRRLLGQAPLDYLLDWRMRLAARALREGRQTLGQIAQSVGYQSDSAFSHAFKRAHGISPSEYRKDWRGADAMP